MNGVQTSTINESKVISLSNCSNSTSVFCISVLNKLELDTDRSRDCKCNKTERIFGLKKPNGAAAVCVLWRSPIYAVTLSVSLLMWVCCEYVLSVKLGAVFTCGS